ncbi:glutathione S-transferase C-terminal domain-containing protein [Streptomyces sp. H39-S7]|uniref:glutathione S-transferase C-terminal domain-containing protein n=1 Tax=Streptomyces sp. H39-S7 TaxID=3004357 RepID=UPI0022AF45E6|nr:glutathione S-transferase C-terminal domain-containing protein [Streptomyces sp. H39-S7]MCZ4123402.1 glutathione S-transferase C-terminal domain-containing protein [Streptomyces sp. H39-S7]
MPETALPRPLTSHPATFDAFRPVPCDPLGAAAARSAHFGSRIGVDLAGGFYPAPGRYQVYLTPGCPRSLRVAITLDLLALTDTVATTLVPVSAGTPDPLASLRSAYEAARYHYDGPLTVPALTDRWSGRVVSNHTPDILRDLADHFAAPGCADLPRLRPQALVTDIDAIRHLLDEDIAEAAQRAGAAPASHRQGEALETLLAALELLDRQLAAGPYALGDELTAADVDLWATLVHLDLVDRLHLDADAVRAIARHDHLWAYVRRLHGHPAFGDNLHTDRMARLHRRTCRGPESSGAAIELPGVLSVT